VLALGEAETVLQVLRHVEGDGHRVTGLGAHLLDGQAVKLAHVVLHGSDAFEIVERLQAIDAAVQRLAGRGAELAEHFGMGAAALRAADHRASPSRLRLLALPSGGAMP
jgi:hypothetical protein